MSKLQPYGAPVHRSLEEPITTPLIYALVEEEAASNFQSRATDFSIVL